MQFNINGRLYNHNQRTQGFTRHRPELINHEIPSGSSERKVEHATLITNNDKLVLV